MARTSLRNVRNGSSRSSTGFQLHQESSPNATYQGLFTVHLSLYSLTFYSEPFLLSSVMCHYWSMRPPPIPRSPKASWLLLGFLRWPRACPLTHSAFAQPLRNIMWVDLQEDKCQQRLGGSSQWRLWWEEAGVAPSSEDILIIVVILVWGGGGEGWWRGGGWQGGEQKAEGALQAAFWHKVDSLFYFTFSCEGEGRREPINLLIYRCSIEPEDIPFQGFDGGAIVACLLEVKIPLVGTIRW